MGFQGFLPLYLKNHCGYCFHQIHLQILLWACLVVLFFSNYLFLEPWASLATSFAFPYEQETSFADFESVDYHHCYLGSMTVEEMVQSLMKDRCIDDSTLQREVWAKEMVPLMDVEMSLMDGVKSLRDEVMWSSCGGFEVSLDCCAWMNGSYLGWPCYYNETVSFDLDAD